MAGDAEFHWVNTPGYSDYEVAGKPLHAVRRDAKGYTPSLCGLWRKEWSFDLFNEDRCRNCLRALAKREREKEARTA